MSQIILTKRVQKTLLTLVVLMALSYLGAGVNDSGKIGANTKTPVKPGYYRVTHVSDGDTFAVSIAGKNETVRMIGIDTPETKDPRVQVQCFGLAASQKTHELLENQTVRLEADAASGDRDKYQRLLRYVYLPNGTMVNQYLVEQGYAFAYTLFPNGRLDDFRQWERDARLANRGLWAGCNIDESTSKKQTVPK